MSTDDDYRDEWRYSDDENLGQQVLDENFVTQNAILKRIQQCRDDIRTVKASRIREAYEGESDSWTFQRAYYHAVDAFVGELQPYLRNTDFPLSDEYWEEEYIGEITFQPPYVVSQPSLKEMTNGIRQGGKHLSALRPRDTLEPQTATLRGLRDFNAADDVLCASWEVMFGPEVSAGDLRRRNTENGVEIADRASRMEPFTVKRYQPLPTELIQKAESLCVEFSYELGMDLEFTFDDFESTTPL